MPASRWARSVVFSLIVPVMALAAQKPCLAPEQAAQHLNSDLCVAIHVYDVVELQDGTRFLDVCAPNTPDDACRFTIVSLWQDRDTVGELRKYRDADVQIRGIVRSLHGRAGIVLSHARQFSGGPPRFRPNPRLARGFGGDQEKPPLYDPNLRAQGGHRRFMNAQERESSPHR